MTDGNRKSGEATKERKTFFVVPAFDAAAVRPSGMRVIEQQDTVQDSKAVMMRSVAAEAVLAHATTVFQVPEKRKIATTTDMPAMDMQYPFDQAFTPQPKKGDTQPMQKMSEQMLEWQRQYVQPPPRKS